MQELFEKRFCDIHTLYMQHSKKDPDDVLQWMWSFVVLSGTAMYIIERPADTPPTKEELSLYRYLNDVTPMESVTPPWTKLDAYEWLLKAGELRLWLQDEWDGRWGALEMDALTRDYIAVLNFCTETKETPSFSCDPSYRA